jgi:polysaccharide chain length determinant protein (PEP-CTERM system associated)
MPTESKSITPGQVIEIIISRRWVLIIPFCLAMVVGIGLSLTLPKKYMARTLILVEPQRVPEEYVQALVSSDINTRISTISQQIMSRTNIEKIISKYKLYSDPKHADMFLEDKVSNMRRRINVDVTRASRSGADSFSISFEGTVPEKVAEIANTLARYFIDENLKVREAQAMGTSNFLDDELTIMRVRLESVEQTLKDYRISHMGGLPEQLDSNLRILDRLQEQVSQIRESIRGAKLRLQVLRVQLVQNGRPQISTADGGPLSEAEQLERHRVELEELESKYTPLHPDVIKLKGKIARFEEKLGKPTTDSPEGAPQSQTAPAAGAFSQLSMLEINGLKGEISRLLDKQKEIEEQVVIYKKRVEATPHREQELMSLNRDYQNIQELYNSLLNRKLESEIAVNMEKKQKGEQFRIVDIAKTPQKPTSPDMKKLFLVVVAAGLGIGGGLIFLLEYLNTSFKSVDAIETHLGLPVIVTLPEVISPKHKFFRRVNLVLSTGGVLVAGCLFSVFAALNFVGKQKVMAIVMRFGIL